MTPTRKVMLRFALVGLGWVALGLSAAHAQLTTGFEPDDYVGSSDGLVLTGQQGWYIPPLSSDHFVFTYDSNGLGIPGNDFGDSQFIGAVATGNGTFPRAQMDFDWTGASVWTVSYDLCVQYNGVGTAVDNISSFSLQDSNVGRYFIAVNTWAVPGQQWNANYQVFNVAGMGPTQFNPGASWMNLNAGQWYRQSTTFDFDANIILSVSITNLDTGDTDAVEPNGWYLAGGAGGGTVPLPTAMRFFVGGGGGTDFGNAMGWDNLDIEPDALPEPAPRARPTIVEPTPGAVTR